MISLRSLFVICIIFFNLKYFSSTLDKADVALEPGQIKQDYSNVEEVRGNFNETTEKNVEDEKSLKEAILDIGYYLRRFKFNGYDPRIFTEGEVTQGNFFTRFPIPPLKNIHWEVKKNCESSFVDCVKYLQAKLSQSILPRRLDSVTIVKQNGWTLANDENLIKSANDECFKLLREDEAGFKMFSGPLQKFHWLTSANYYMCLYTLKETNYLRTFTEECDNFASCIPWNIGPNNKDIRANNKYPFACALYSFCPDPCCPLKHVQDFTACFSFNPCVASSSADHTCSFQKRHNVNLESIMLNQWNVSCRCDERGMRWDSKSSMCIDIDECFELESACDVPEKSCKNLPGSYKCVCSPIGYKMNVQTLTCEQDPVMQHVYHPKMPSEKTKNRLELQKNYFVR